MEEEEVEGPEQKDVEAQEAVKKDVNKMNIKELKDKGDIGRHEGHAILLGWTRELKQVKFQLGE